MLAALVLLAVVFLCGLVCTRNLRSIRKLTCWLQIPDPLPPSSHGQSSTQAEPTFPAAGRDELADEVGMAFATFDSDGDGVITVQELWQSLTRMGISSSDRDVADMIRGFDSNSDGVVDIDEFREIYRSVGGAATTRPSAPEEEEEACMREAFDVFDGDGDGQITVDELNAVLKSMGLKEGYTAASCREMISKVDMDGDGKVNFEEFKLMMKFNQSMIN